MSDLSPVDICRAIAAAPTSFSTDPHPSLTLMVVRGGLPILIDAILPFLPLLWTFEISSFYFILFSQRRMESKPGGYM